MKGKLSIWVMNGLLAAVAVMLAVALFGGGPSQPAYAGSGASLEKWMMTTVAGTEKLVIVKEDGGKLRILVYRTDGVDDTLTLEEMRELNWDIALTPEAFPSLGKGPRNRTYSNVKKIHMESLKRTKGR